MSVATPLRVGIIGVGWGAFIQAPGFRLVSEFEVAALCGRRPDRLAAAAERLGVEDTSTDWRSFVERPDLDVIAVVTPTALHHPVAMAALAAGKHVLCEKPLAASVEESAEMVQRAADVGAVTATAFELRWLPDRLAIWEMVAGGYLGDLYFARMSHAKDLWHPSHGPKAPWVYSLDEGGGQLNAGLSHDLDFLRAAFGEIDRVCAEVRTTIDKRELEDGTVTDITGDDTGGLLLRMASGALAVLSYTVMGAHAASAELEAYGSAGSIVAHTTGSASLKGRAAGDRLLRGRADEPGLEPFRATSREPRSRPELPPNRFSSLAMRAFALMLEDWLPAFSGQPTSVPTFEDGLAVQRLIEAARTSSQRGRWVRP